MSATTVISPANGTTDAQKQALFDELYLNIELYVHGVALDPEELKLLGVV